jgi:ABC-type dipeptide/oligopeptide/nickel transport system ATPase component
MAAPAHPILMTSPAHTAARPAVQAKVSLLEIRGLKTHFKTDDGWLHAVDGVDLTIERGETVSVVGESGCGKTVTAMTVLKLLPMPPGRIVAGQVLWQGRTSSPRAPRRCGGSAPRKSRSSSRSR